MFVIWITRSYRQRRVRDLALLQESGIELKEGPELISQSQLQHIEMELHEYFVTTADTVRGGAGADLRYALNPNELISGRPQEAARGINFYLKAPDADVYEKMVHGVVSIRREFADYGTEEDKECLDYVLTHPAGSSTRSFPNGMRDQGRQGEMLSDFVNHPYSVQSGLSDAHVLALRLYTTAAYKSINDSLRDLGRPTPHRFPVTVNFIAEGLKRLRYVGANDDAGHQKLILWRGMRNLRVSDVFTTAGGTELAPMSATADLRIALRYAMSPHLLVFKIVTNSFMERGVDLSFLSCFPEESEHLFAPLTYLRPTGNAQTLECESVSVTLTVVEVQPIYLGLD